MATPKIDLSLSDVFKQIDETIKRLQEHQKNERISCNELVEELKLNLRLCQLYLEYNGDLDKIVPRLSRIIFDEQLSTGFNFKSLRKRKIVKRKKFADYNSASWQGKLTPKLLRNTYDKVTELVTFYPVAHPIKINPRLRMSNIQEKLEMLLATIDCD